MDTIQVLVLQIYEQLVYLYVFMSPALAMGTMAYPFYRLLKYMINRLTNKTELDVHYEGTELGQNLIRSLEDAKAYHKGEKTNVRVTERVKGDNDV